MHGWLRAIVSELVNAKSYVIKIALSTTNPVENRYSTTTYANIYVRRNATNFFNISHRITTVDVAEKKCNIIYFRRESNVFVC